MDHPAEVARQVAEYRERRRAQKLAQKQRAKALQNQAGIAHQGAHRTLGAAGQQYANEEDQDQNDLGDGLEEDNYTCVDTAELEKNGLIPHPDKIAEAAALSSVTLPKTDYKLALPAHVLFNGISALQVQFLQLACTKHQTFLPSGERAGFFLGDGPGVGKGRQIASLVFENLLRCRKKAVWFSASADLALDAERDFHDIGALRYDPVRIHDLKRLNVKAGQSLNGVARLDCGILFSTYDMLISGGKQTAASKSKAQAASDAELLAGRFEDPGKKEFGTLSRLHQIVEWVSSDSSVETFDGVIVFDESHKAKNCMGKDRDTAGASKRGYQAESKTSRAVVEIQKRLPRARILYVSATGATEPENLCFMTRLGLWGEKTPFLDKKSLVSMLKNRGISAMEIVAMELKMSGLFLARSLSYEGVAFQQVQIDVDPAFEEIYDQAVEIWWEIFDLLDSAAEDGQLIVKEDAEAKSKATAMRGAYAANLRFFRQMCTAAKVHKTVEQAKEALQAGHCVVIGLQSTGEARTAAMVGKKVYDEDAIFENFADPAGLIMQQTIKSNVPINYPRAAELYKRAVTLKLPHNPLDVLIDELGGPSKVAEMSGRRRRMIRNPNGPGFVYRLVAAEGVPLDQVNIQEKKAFQSGKKLIAIISDAASTGISLQADRNELNTRLRVHITLELAWSADKTVQQLGRTHRSNQAQPPKYIILSSNICGEHRFASAVAKRLQQLGALTQGDRHAANAADALSSFNVDNKWGALALGMMSAVLRGRQEIPDKFTPSFIADNLDEDDPNYEAQKAEAWEEFKPQAIEALEQMKVFSRAVKNSGQAQEIDENIVGKDNGLQVNKLLNRLLCIPLELQAKIFSCFSAMLDYQIREAKRNGRYDECGIVKPGCKQVEFTSSEVIYTQPYSGHQVRHEQFTIDRGVPWEDALQRLQQELADDPHTRSGFWYHIHGVTGARQNVLAIERAANGRKKQQRQGKKDNAPGFFRIIRPDTGFESKDLSWKDFKGHYKPVKREKEETDFMQRTWQRQWRDDPRSKRRETVHLISGSILSIFPCLDVFFGRKKINGRTQNLQCWRMEASDGTHGTIGVHVPNPWVEDLLKVIAEQLEIDEARAACMGPAPSNADPYAELESSPSRPSAEDSIDTCRAAAASTLPQEGNKAPETSPSSAEGADPEEHQADAEPDSSDKENALPKERNCKVRRKVQRIKHPNRSNQAAAASEDFAEERQHRLASGGLWESVELPPMKEVFTAREKETMARTRKVLAEKPRAGRKSDPGPGGARRQGRPKRAAGTLNSDGEEVLFGGSDADDEEMADQFAPAESDVDLDPEEARKGALADLMAKRSGTAGKVTRRAASAGPSTRRRDDDARDSSGDESGWESVKDSKRKAVRRRVKKKQGAVEPASDAPSSAAKSSGSMSGMSDALPAGSSCDDMGASASSGSDSEGSKSKQAVARKAREKASSSGKRLGKSSLARKVSRKGEAASRSQLEDSDANPDAEQATRGRQGSSARKTLARLPVPVQDEQVDLCDSASDVGSPSPESSSSDDEAAAEPAGETDGLAVGGDNAPDEAMPQADASSPSAVNLVPSAKASMEEHQKHHTAAGRFTAHVE
ncbi:hypothetical protein WJX84_004264 [Apatococcus fuscideae]|uniref:Uncharacterized protein n=1 Tax=Apatococcus fuscideae TaxID=2026836 RepID=A0AAW1T286_9CHLO